MSISKLAVTACAATLALPASARIDEEASPIDYTCLTKGGKYIFVMLRPERYRRYAYDYYIYSDSSSVRHTRKDGVLHKIYPSSGLYRNDGSKKPLWTVDWYSFEVWPCSDGEHIVRWGPWARMGDKGQTLALAFYRSGLEIKRYRVADLVPDFQKLPFSTSHYRWEKQKSFDDAGSRVKVLLHQGYDYQTPGQTLQFDVRSGLMRKTARASAGR